MDREAALRDTAERHHQQHLFTFWDALTTDQREALLDDLDSIDFDLVTRLCAGTGIAADGVDAAALQPPEVYPPTPTAALAELYAESLAGGESLLRNHKVAAMVVAGGQGTRLGFDGPKGTLPVSPVKSKTLFELFAEQLRAVRNRYDCRLPWFVMTSDATDTATRAYFEAHDYLGLPREEVRFFKQGKMPAVDGDGRILLAERHRVAMSPNGHGGCLMALKDSGALDEMKQRGIEAISYFQIDNPLCSPANPLFLGLHTATGADLSSIAVRKADDFEKVGVFAEVDGKLSVIEYSDLPDELATARNDDGSRRFDAGSIAIHTIATRFIDSLTDGSGAQLPWHVAQKKVPCVDLGSGTPIDPDEPNARKFEMFIFDAIPLANRSIVLEQPRAECFSPVKNARGVDSLETCQRDMVQRHLRWLEACGVNLPKQRHGEPTVKVEISPLFALDADMLQHKVAPNLEITAGDEVYLG
jgi:UDP-N-acetylglucosamine/UDP-N-acetylgalactosamine diphosphorylase